MVRLPSPVCRKPACTEVDDVENDAGTSVPSSPSRSESRGSLSSCSGSPVSEDCEMEDFILGSGGFGVVRRARLKSSGLQCAVKVMTKRRWISVSMADQEIRINDLLEHPHICHMIDSFEDEHSIYLVFDLLSGHELFSEIEDGGAVDEDRVIVIMRQVLSALQYCHERSIIHRDVKPDNIMISAGPTAKLIDFGLAVSCNDLTQTSVVGTRSFLAPEAARGWYSKASDMWSVGITLTCLFRAGFGGPYERLSASSSLHVGALQGEAKPPHDLVCTELAGNVISLLLKNRPSERLTASQVVMGPWLRATV